MAYSYTTRNGQRVQVAVAAAFDRLNAAFKARFGLDLIVSSGTRTNAEQWNFWRIYQNGGNLAAYPGTSNHEENGPSGPRALDVRDSGGDAGVTVKGTTRANWLRQNAPAYGFNPAGYGFSRIEPWHIEYTGALNNSTGGGSSNVSQEVKNQQSFLNQKRGENLAVDGEYGPATKAAYARYQTFLRGYGYTGDIDGIWGAGTQAAHQKYYDSLNSSAPGQITVDGNWGEATTRELQKRLGGVSVDGQWGTESRRALQVALNSAPFDGQAGPITNKAFQTFLKQEGFYKGDIDGEFGYGSIVALQQFLNTGRKFYAVVTPTTPTQPPVPVVEAAKSVKPVLPWAIRGWDAPKGRENRAPGSKITAFAIHHTASLVDQENYFKGISGSIPTWYVRDDVIEMTRPGLRPVTTANSNNFTVSAETQNITGAPEWKVSDKSVEQLASIAAWLHSYDGKTLDGIPVEFKLDRQHIKGHKEFAGNSTACPGPYLEALLDSIVARAKVIYAEEYMDDPTVPVTPTEPPTTEIPDGYTLVKNSQLKAINDTLEGVQIVINNLLGGK